MTQDQVMGLLRQLLPVIGTILTAFGWTDAAGWANWTNMIMAAAGPAMILGSAVWTVIANTKAAKIKAVAAMKETSVASDGTIKIHDTKLADTAVVAATPPGQGS